jgi:hypothetical protein
VTLHFHVIKIALRTKEFVSDNIRFCQWKASNVRTSVKTWVPLTFSIFILQRNAICSLNLSLFGKIALIVLFLYFRKP